MEIVNDSLTLSLAPAGGSGVDISEASEVFDLSTGDAFRVTKRPESVEFVNFQASLTVDFQPGEIIVSDHAAEGSIRPEFSKLIADLLGLLGSLAEAPLYHEWGISGVAVDVDEAEESAFAQLFDVEHVDWIIGGGEEPMWMSEEVRLFSSSSFSDWLRINLAPEYRPGWTRAVRYTITAQFNEALDVSHLDDEGKLVLSGSRSILERLMIGRSSS